MRLEATSSGTRGWSKILEAFGTRRVVPVLLGFVTLTATLCPSLSSSRVFRTTPRSTDRSPFRPQPYLAMPLVADSFVGPMKQWGRGVDPIPNVNSGLPLQLSATALSLPVALRLATKLQFGLW